MIERLGERWRAFSLREKRLIVGMLALALGLVLWLGIVRPIGDALADARAAVIVASDRVGALRAAVDLIGATRPARTAPTGALVHAVEASAAEAGLELQSNAPAGADGASIAIASARPPALFGWLGHLEQDGIAVETIDVQPAANNTVAVHALLRRTP